MKSKLPIFIAAFTFATMGAFAQPLDVQIVEHAEADLDTCALGQVTGLKSDGDGFLSVRTGPGTSFTKIDELKNDDRVWLYDSQGDWLGVVYDVDTVNCSPIDADRPVQTDGKMGWVHRNWVTVIAG